MNLRSQSPEETQKLGIGLGRLAQPGDLFMLVGELGAGKTCLTQGIAWGLDIAGYATSPTFVVINQYMGRLPLYHIDIYRLDSIEEVVDLGLDDYLYGNGVCGVEWADKASNVLPPEHLLVLANEDPERQIAFRVTHGIDGDWHVLVQAVDSGQEHYRASGRPEIPPSRHTDLRQKHPPHHPAPEVQWPLLCYR